MFNGISVYHDNGGSYSIDFDSNRGGSSTISSSGTTELFGLGGLTSGGATVFKVRAIVTQSFSDVSSNTAPDESSNKFTTQSILELSNSNFFDSLNLKKNYLIKFDSQNSTSVQIEKIIQKYIIILLVFLIIKLVYSWTRYLEK